MVSMPLRNGNIRGKGGLGLMLSITSPSSRDHVDAVLLDMFNFFL